MPQYAASVHLSGTVWRWDTRGDSDGLDARAPECRGRGSEVLCRGRGTAGWPQYIRRRWSAPPGGSRAAIGAYAVVSSGMSPRCWLLGIDLLSPMRPLP